MTFTSWRQRIQNVNTVSRLGSEILVPFTYSIIVQRLVRIEFNLPLVSPLGPFFVSGVLDAECPISRSSRSESIQKHHWNLSYWEESEHWICTNAKLTSSIDPEKQYLSDRWKENESKDVGIIRSSQSNNLHLSVLKEGHRFSLWWHTFECTSFWASPQSLSWKGVVLKLVANELHYTNSPQVNQRDTEADQIINNGNVQFGDSVRNFTIIFCNLIAIPIANGVQVRLVWSICNPP